MIHVRTRPARRRGLPVVCLLVTATTALTALAQARPDPLDSKASVPAVVYQSSLKPGPADSKPISWREANDVVGRIGGWRVYAREAQQPDAVAAPTPTPPATPTPTPTPTPTSTPAPKVAPAGHAGHGGNSRP